MRNNSGIKLVDVFYNNKNKLFSGRLISLFDLPPFVFTFCDIKFFGCAIFHDSNIMRKVAMPFPKPMHRIPVNLLSCFLANMFSLYF